jgi:hypothetical protein
VEALAWTRATTLAICLVKTTVTLGKQSKTGDELEGQRSELVIDSIAANIVILGAKGLFRPTGHPCMGAAFGARTGLRQGSYSTYESKSESSVKRLRPSSLSNVLWLALSSRFWVTMVGLVSVDRPRGASSSAWPSRFLRLLL